MTVARIIDGKAIAADVRAKVAQRLGAVGTGQRQPEKDRFQNQREDDVLLEDFERPAPEPECEGQPGKIVSHQSNVGRL